MKLRRRPRTEHGTDVVVADEQDQPGGRRRQARESYAAEGPRGVRGVGGGAWELLSVPPTFRATSLQVCGLWPFSASASRPAVGVPVGHDMETGATVCCDMITWFQHGLISSPSMLVLGLQGLGKSSWTIRQILGLADRGVVPLVLGDIKGEYGQVITALGGAVQSYGQSEQLNVLAHAAMLDAAARIGGDEGEILYNQALQRAAEMTSALVQIARRRRLDDWEMTLISKGVRHLHEESRKAGALPPTLPDLSDLLSDPPQVLITSALTENAQEFRELTKSLRRSLLALLDGPLGRTFGGQTTHQLPLDAPAVCVDVSAISKAPDDVKAAIMMATWSEGYGAVEAANALAQAGYGPQRHFLMVMDEMWEPLRIEGAGLVDKLDGLTRLNRNDGVANIYITHSLKDMESMASEADARKARGFAERSSIVVTAGLAKDDLRALSQVKKLSEAEIAQVSSWTTPDGYKKRMVTDPLTGKKRPAPPPGAGKVLIKVGERAGIRTQVTLTRAELNLHDTNARWVS